jgi:hypothetical protein
VYKGIIAGKKPTMTTLFSDTSPAAQRILIDRLRPLAAWRKLKMVADMNATVRQLAMAGLRQRHPGASPDELRRLMADLLLGADLAAQVYGPLGDTRGPLDDA